ncbi:DUF3307 domain-containing protein [Kitasatospora purpeofusca]|uniref:DUF3307 domain-containing protein n=1 Tax=Kitasatospora purpeofusca TaxID=67352 RepID=UPI002E0FF5A4|nr:DUF3307 domain-containing protein [Kitasatospora purpeofusca]
MNNHTLMLATLGAVWAVLSVGHTLADHVLGQTDHQAANKAAPTPQQVKDGTDPRRGWSACLAHVAQYHLVVAGLYALTRLAVPLPATAIGVTAAVVWSAGTHAVLDRRWLVRLILERTGSAAFAQLNSGGLNGMYVADQALHATALLGSAIMLTRF